MYGSAVCEFILRLSRGTVLHIYTFMSVGALQYTMFVFGFSLSLGVSQNKEGYNATVFNECDSLLQLFYL